MRGKAAALALCIAIAVCNAQPPPPRLTGKVYLISPLQKLPDFARLEPVATIETNPLYVPSRSSAAGYPGIPNRHDWFAIDYRWKIYVRDPGEYNFRLTSDDGSKFYIDGNVVIDNDLGVGLWTKDKVLKLSGGMHQLRLSYFQGPLDHNVIALTLLVDSPGSKDFRPFDIRNFSPPGRAEEWKYGSPADFVEPPEPDARRVRLKDVLSGRVSAAAGFPPEPTEEQRQSFLHEVQVNALRYAEDLPNFVCTEVVRDYTRDLPNGTLQKNWELQGSFTLTLSHSVGGDRYTVIDVARKSKSEVKKISEGEFGPALVSIFAPETKTVFHWNHWTRWQSRLTRVYEYWKERENSQYKIAVGIKPSERRTTVTGRHGFIFADDKTRVIVRITGEADGIPSNFPAQAVANSIDYEWRNLGASTLLLPVRVEQLSSTAQVDFRRVIEFRNYKPAD